MTLAILFKLVHVFAAFWFIGGILGRTVALRQAARTTNVKTVEPLVNLAGIFEKSMVIPGSLLVLIAGIVTAVLGGWSLFGFLEGQRTNWLLLSLALFLSNIPLIPFVYTPRGRIFDAALRDALERGAVTPRLASAFADPVVAAAHLYELMTITLIVILMVLKPL
jgi:Predicted integral membrane protein (DUF2269)